jgi:hypothetical protein
MEQATEEKFETLITIGPAYDERHKGNGIASCKMFLVLKGSKGAVTLAVSTAWYLPCTREWKEICIARHGLNTWEPRGDAVNYCSPVPLHDWQEGRENCDWLGCTCYGDIGFTMADEPFALLLSKGSDAVFEWLKNYYHSIFNKKEQ